MYKCFCLCVKRLLVNDEAWDRNEDEDGDAQDDDD